MSARDERELLAMRDAEQSGPSNGGWRQDALDVA